MKKTFLFIAFLLLYVFVKAQIPVKVEQLSSHIGDSVTVCTKIFGGIYLDKSSNKITLLNAGGAYPNAPLTLFINSKTRKQFKQAPEVFYKDKNVCISGKLILYNDKPEIVITDAKQIALKNE